MSVDAKTPSPEEVTEIWWLLRGPDKIRQEDIAKKYGLSSKTICRIANGKSWRSITERLEAQFRTETSVRAVVKLNPYSEEQMDVLDIARAVKNDLCLDHDAPTYWGWYDWLGKKHGVLTDGAICWLLGDQGTELGVKFASSNINEYPIFSDQCHELASLPLLDLLTQAFDDTLSFGDCLGDVVLLEGGKHGTLQIRRKYVDACNKHKLIPYEVASSDEVVYFVKVNRKPRGENELLLVAAVATLQE
jgi:hypothetical protein